MRKPNPHYISSRLLDKKLLWKLKLKAMRAGVWFRSLPRIDRALFDLSLNVDVKFRSPLLNKSILSIKSKLEEFLESKISHVMRECGFSLASKLSLIAQKWGNISSARWVDDTGFVRYLAIMDLNGRVH